MKYLFSRMWFAVLLLTACGGDNPVDDNTVWEIPIIAGPFVVDSGSYISYSFAIDLTQMSNPYVVVSISTGNVEDTVNVLVLSSTNFDLWQASGSYAAIFESAQTPGGNLEQPIESSGIFYLVVSNIADTNNSKAIDAVASIFYQQIPQ